MKTSCIPVFFFREMMPDKTGFREGWIKMAVEVGLIIGLCLVIAGGLILMLANPYWVNLLMVISSTTAMATLYVLILDLNHPFSEGELWEISPSSFEKVRDRLRNT